MFLFASIWQDFVHISFVVGLPDMILIKSTIFRWKSPRDCCLYHFDEIGLTTGWPFRFRHRVARVWAVLISEFFQVWRYSKVWGYLKVWRYFSSDLWQVWGFLWANIPGIPHFLWSWLGDLCSLGAKKDSKMKNN